MNKIVIVLIRLFRNCSGDKLHADLTLGVSEL